MYMKYFCHHILINSMLLFIMLGLYLFYNGKVLIMDWNFFSYSEFQMSSSFYLDNLSLIFLVTVSFVGFSVMNYARCYMVGDSMSMKFFITMFLFIMSMLILSSSANLIWLMVGWDGLGLTSFFLIMYFQNTSSLNSSMVTFMSNRIGDLFMIMSIMWMLNLYSMGTFSCYTACLEIFVIVSILMTLGGMSKSAQVPFSAWLPLAMAAPTPVSALVHSSTLVTAGVFLTIRFFPVIDNPMFMLLLIFSSCMSLILSSSSAMWEFDLKKIIALSTLSHIGFMLMFVAMGNIPAAIMHMVMHALFKSLLFMCAGMMIHEGFNLQDIRKIFLPPSLKQKISSSFIISVLSMMGTPFLAGFYSKDFMVLTCLNFSASLFSYTVVMLSAMLSCAYSIRLVYCIFNNFSYTMTFFISDAKSMNEMEFSVIMSSISSSIMGGLLINWIIEMETTQFSFNDPFSKTILLVIMISGVFLGLMLSTMSSHYNVLSFKLMFNNMWFVGWLYMPFQKILFISSNMMFNFNDIKGWLDFMVYNFNNNLMMLFKSLNMITMNNLLNIVFMSILIVPVLMLLLIMG